MIFDAHADILTDMYQEKDNYKLDSFKKRHLDLYKKGGVTHSIFVNWINPDTNNSSLFVDIFENAFKELENNTDIFKICLNYEDMLLSYKDKKIGVILGMEGISQLEGVSHLRDLYSKGVRHATLTWNEENSYASGLNNLNTRGITKEGIEILHEMEKLGMIIDLAHLNESSFQDVVDNTSSPLIISHGNTKQICSHIRNYTDDQLLSIKKSNGVIGLCGIPMFISDDPSEWNVKHFVKHIDYAVKLIGIDHVGLGFDFCYYLSNQVEDNRVDGLKNIGDIGNIFDELTKIGYSQDDIDKIKHLNFERVVKTILK